MNLKFQGTPTVPGVAQGRLLVSHEPLSFWGGYDQHTGEIIDRRHSLSGQMAAGSVLALPFSRGSSTGTAVLLEAIKAGNAPAAMLTTGTDSFFALASIVADEMYQASIPIIALSEADFSNLRSGLLVRVDESGLVSVVQEA